MAEDLIEAARTCRQNGATKVAISSITPRSSFHFQLYRKQLNDQLRELCTDNGFDFIDSNEIVLKNHILRDGVHLNNAGTELLRRNFLNYLDSC